ncbi:retrotransposon hot spot protein (RHS,pseudogene), putative [Trypanosoma brucei gambiense DAL972]|uniref:retrotransposon hot spot protein (RHS,pseudogene), putative n=1 Tax=Trypanosoma brucei gambiense (strain MHOM/CI/86/DAL972) TaxID=679716 RepID=UPI0001B9CB5A|nr:LOW QUALITY PROTEIN: retrotransposon hot spot protein (RHS,pseudogene), putative [Trypanosoma brucei gambiense DAL972]CBH17322.1 retrotransposon hot spot protein (RHS,pseudogene), putative [Trypanosoma brucei gambiense DAL972]|eukprot:XP_011779586.1 LOW QUALITY PROTEIN: retrotransposon hot spot protein (RHS,pseudogene), putative [Trypanosoma brucei gambiense DAL972]
MSRRRTGGGRRRNNANQQVAGNFGAAVRRPRDENVPPPPAAAAAAQPPQIRQRTEGGPYWTMNSKVRNVLLEDYAGLRNMTVNDFIQKFVGGTFAVAEAENVRMPVFVQSPEDYILDARLQGIIRGLDEFQLLRAVIYLSEKEIYYLRQWEEKGRGEIREFVGPVARGMLDGALAAAKEARERATQTAGGAVELKGVYESIYNATWGYVESGHREEPLGMKVFGGRPQRMWTKEEVDVSHTPETMYKPLPRRGNLEIAVLTSQMGWPYTSCKANPKDDDINHKRGVGYVFNSDVYIRRETLRVWHKVEERLNQWLMGEVTVNPMFHVLIGTPGIGKSFSVGSLLLYPWRCRPPQRGARVQYPVSSGEAKSQQRSFHGEHCCAPATASYSTGISSVLLGHRFSFVGPWARASVPSAVSSALRCCCPVMWTSKKGLPIGIFGRVQGGRLLAPSAVFRSYAEIQQKL